MKVDPVIGLTLSWSLALLLVSAAIHKLSDWNGFRDVLASYRLVAAPLTTSAAALLLVVECMLAAALVLRAPAAGAGAAALLTAYAGAMAANLLRDRRLADCGCGGRRQPLSWGLVARNLLLAAVALVLLAPEAERSLGWLDWTTVVAAVAVSSLLYAAADALLAAWVPAPEEWV